jgi:hypothetical protein
VFFVVVANAAKANVISLVKHLTLIHGHCPGKSLHFKKCVQVGCSRVFGTLSGFTRHLNKAHEELTEAVSDNDGGRPSTAANSFAANIFAANNFAANSSAANSFAANSFAANSFAANSFAANSFGDVPAPSSRCDSALYNKSIVDNCAATIEQLKAAGFGDST